MGEWWILGDGNSGNSEIMEVFIHPAVKEIFRSSKTALLNIFILTVDQITTYNMKGVGRSEEPFAAFSSLLWFELSPLS